MTHQKTSFRFTAYYHILVMILVLVFSTINMIQNPINYLSGSSILLIVLGLLIGIAGFKLIKGDRKAALFLIVINLLQVFSFIINRFVYKLWLGPEFSFDFLGGGVFFGFNMEIAFQYFVSSNPYDQMFRINLINLVFAIYLLDQVRFIPKRGIVSNDSILDS